MLALIKDLIIKAYYMVQMQHHKKLKDLHIGDLMVEISEEFEEESDSNMGSNLLAVASTGNAASLDELLLKERLDPDIGDSKGRTPLVYFYTF